MELTKGDIYWEIDDKLQQVKALLDMIASVTVTENPNITGSDSQKLLTVTLSARVLQKLVSEIDNLNEALSDSTQD